MTAPALGDRVVARELWLDPYPLFSRLRRDAPVWRLPGENAFLVSTWELVTEATSRVDDFSNYFRYMLFAHDDGTLGALETGPTGPDVFAGADLDRLGRWMVEGAHLVGGLMTLGQMASRAGEVAAMAPWTSAQLDAALASPTDGDVLSAAAAAVRAGALTHEEASFALMVLVGAGAETTTSLIGIAVGLLADRPELQDELRADPAKVPAFVEEVLRFESPFRYHPRTAARATSLGGVEIPEGALVLLLWSSANRDGTVFEDPDDLVVGRRNVHLHLGFGRGIHHCVGAPLARLEARVVLTRLLARTRSFALDSDRPPTWSDSIWIHRHEELPVVFEPR